MLKYVVEVRNVKENYGIKLIGIKLFGLVKNLYPEPAWQKN